MNQFGFGRLKNFHLVHTAKYPTEHVTVESNGRIPALSVLNPGGWTLDELLKEVLSVVEEDVQWWNDAAEYCEDFASNLPEEERVKWELLAAGYRERAKTHSQLSAKMRQRSGG